VIYGVVSKLEKLLRMIKLASQELGFQQIRQCPPSWAGQRTRCLQNERKEQDFGDLPCAFCNTCRLSPFFVLGQIGRKTLVAGPVHSRLGILGHHDMGQEAVPCILDDILDLVHIHLEEEVHSLGRMQA
jgi:hypothetical protein